MSEARAPARSDDDAEIIREAQDRFKRCQDWESLARRNWLDDYKFSHGDAYNNYQWPDELRTGRERDEKPFLTVNKARQHILQIINDAKQNKPSVKFRPVGDDATKEAADIYDGIMRHIEYVSKAQIAYDVACAFQVRAGLGFLRVDTDYIDDDSFDQELYVRAIHDPLTVFMDPDSHESDKSDMRYCFVFEDIPKDLFRIAYPDYPAANANFPLSQDWVTDNHVRRAEYWRKTEFKDELILMVDPETGDRTTVRKSKIPAEIWDKVVDEPNTKTRPIRSHKIEQFIIIGDQVAERNDWAGIYIPIVPVIGEETVIDGKLDRKGHTRALIDPQRMFNYWCALDLATPLPTPSGWTTMGQTKVGDWLLDDKGAPVKIVGTSPIYVHHDCFRVTFDDGSKIDADAGHRWCVEERGKRKAANWTWSDRVITTKELTPKKHFIAVSSPFDLPVAELPIHPYLLGAWLGDGKTAEPTIVAGLVDIEEMRAIVSSFGHAVGPAKTYGVEPAAGEFTVHGIRREFRQLNLLGHKHIPAIYLRAARAQRELLLQGLMDTDGSISARKQCSFTTVSKELADGFAELLRTLGFKAVRCDRAGKLQQFPGGKVYQCQDIIQFSFSADPDQEIFRLARKRKVHKEVRHTHSRRTKRFRIVSVEPIASVPVKCVEVDSGSHLYLAGLGMVPTHNSEATAQVALQTKVPYVTDARAVEGFETEWAEANTTTLPYLPYNGLDDEGNQIQRPTREQPPVMATAYIQGMQMSEAQMMMASGQYQSQFGEPSNERSGKAINERQRQGDNATYHFIDGLARGVRQIGRICLDLIPKIYDARQMVQVLGEDGSERLVLLDPTQKSAYMKHVERENNIIVELFNPNVGRYDVQADIGPNYSTRRQEAWNAFVQIAAQSPQVMQIAGDLVFRAADFPMAEDLADRFKRTIPPGILGDDEALPPGVQQMIDQGKQQVQMLLQQNQQLTRQFQEAQDRVGKEQLRIAGKDSDKSIDAYRAETDRMGVLAQNMGMDPQQIAQIAAQLVLDALGTHLTPGDTQNPGGVAFLQPPGGGAPPQPPPGAPPTNGVTPPFNGLGQ